MEDKEELLWCSDQHFDNTINKLSVSEVLDLVQTLQRAMTCEQQTFDSLRHQLSLAHADTELHERLSTALCSSQARLARLCARNMRCFVQAVGVKQPESEVSISDHHIYQNLENGKEVKENGREEENVYENVKFVSDKRSSDDDMSADEYETVECLRTTEELLPKSARMLLYNNLEPDIPSPDYASDEEDCFSDDQANSYTEQKGLSVILEEDEDSDTDTLTRDSGVELASAEKTFVCLPETNGDMTVESDIVEIRKPRLTTRSWDLSLLLKQLYEVPEPLVERSPITQCVNIEGHLEKLPSGKKKATFWNAWKRRYFRAKDGFLYYYQNSQSEKPSMTLSLMGGRVDTLDPSMLGLEDKQPVLASTMLGIDDGKGHYVVVKCTSQQEAQRWKLALQTHVAENFNATYVQPWPLPKEPAFLKNTIIIDLGSTSVRAGILCTQPSLPQLFFPTIMAVDKVSKKRVYGAEALAPQVRAASTLFFPARSSSKITKYSVDISAVEGILEKVFRDLNVEPTSYDLMLCVSQSYNSSTQSEIMKILIERFGVRAVNMTHQSVLALYAYNATSGIVVDIGERTDIVPISEGYIVETGVTRVPYGGGHIVDHLRHSLAQKQYSLVTHVEAFLIRHVLESMCYTALHYNEELSKWRQHPQSIEKSITIQHLLPNAHWESIALDVGRFQPTEGLFSPETWGLDSPGIHKMVHKAIQECSMDARKEMTRSIYLSGGVTMLPGFAERLHKEVDKLTPAALVPKVHASPYRYHASYLGACVLANTSGVEDMKISRHEWSQRGSGALKKWTL